jgi:DNA mismatch repair protein MutS
LKTGQRYISAYLQELQGEVFSSKENLCFYHAQQADVLFARWGSFAEHIYAYADILAKIDLYTTMALLMHERDWSLPLLSVDGDLEIQEGRHPVVEAYLPKEEQFIPNDTLCTKEYFFHLIT